MQIVPYGLYYATLWNDFVCRARNATFLFHRDFMDYHQERFTDASLLFFSDKGKLLALLPATAHWDEREIRSHGGLTYGTFLLSDAVGATQVGQMMRLTLQHFGQKGYLRFVFKPLPYCYHRIPTQEDLYWAFRLGARRTACGLSTCIDLSNQLPYATLRKRQIKKAQQHGLRFENTPTTTTFHSLLRQTLQARHQTQPVHTAAEMQQLTQRFPQHIQCWTTSTAQGEILAGTWLFVMPPVVHTQYLAVNERGRACGALDALLDHVIALARSGDLSAGQTIRYFDFGISTTHKGQYLNTGLLTQKEGFGGRAVVYEEYLFEGNLLVENLSDF